MRSTSIASRPKNYRIPTNGLVLSLELTRRTLLSVITNAFAYPNVHFPTPHNIVGSSTNISIPIEMPFTWIRTCSQLRASRLHTFVWNRKRSALSADFSEEEATNWVAFSILLNLI
ncbi:unnamed protein product [Albugo candida]|uniref:Uncharacterized protein n=1 Tax=Albugo candida TaxID=65357 RepID=A0A024GTV8_9STRA|nr:unnamed protein product [Albugo candida]|eukprot:CCI49992.1 unnamed protein product [Albugo candida]